MEATLIDGTLHINMYDYLNNLSIEEKREMLNDMKIQDDFFRIFLEMFAEDFTINNSDCWTSSIYEWRKKMLEMTKEKFIEDIPRLSIIKTLEEKYQQYSSNERLYWHIYHDAPEHIRNYFMGKDFYKSEYELGKEGSEFKEEVIKTIIESK